GLGGLDVRLVEGEDRRVVLRVLLVAGSERVDPGDARTVDQAGRVREPGVDLDDGTLSDLEVVRLAVARYEAVLVAGCIAVEELRWRHPDLVDASVVQGVVDRDH